MFGFSRKLVGTTTLSITPLSIMTFSITRNKTSLSIMVANNPFTPSVVALS